MSVDHELMTSADRYTARCSCGNWVHKGWTHLSAHQQHIADATMGGYEEFSVVEWPGDGPERLSECKRCGAVVRSETAHDAWHAELGS